MFDGSVHNDLVKSFFRVSGRTPIPICGGATGVKQVSEDSNFNGRKKKFWQTKVAGKSVAALMKVT